MTGPHLRAYERHPLALPVRCLGALDEGVVEVHGTTADVSAGGCRVVLEREREGLARLHPIVIAMVEVGGDDVVMLGQLVRDDQAAHAGVLRIAFLDRGAAWEHWVVLLARLVAAGHGAEA
jgi:hypothetical protein